MNSVSSSHEFTGVADPAQFGDVTGFANGLASESVPIFKSIGLASHTKSSGGIPTACLCGGRHR